MNALIVAIVAALVFWHARWATRRRFVAFPAAVWLRDIGIGIAVLYVIFAGSVFWLDYAWWHELGQTPTFWQFLRIRWLPQTAGALLGIALLLAVFHFVRHRSGSRLARTRLFSWMGTLAAILLGALISINILDPWTIALYLGATDTGIYSDPLFHKDLTFYLFRLPFYQMVFEWLAALAVVALGLAAVMVALGSSATRLQDLRARFEAQMQGRGYAADPITVNRTPPPVTLGAFVRITAVLLLVLFAVTQFFARYQLLYASHQFLYGADYVDVHLGLPLIWVQIIGALALAVVVAAARRRPVPMRMDAGSRASWPPPDAPRWLAAATLIAAVALVMGPAMITGLVRSLYVRPNELTLERPYIADHIRATRMAFGLEQQSHEEAFTPRAADSLDLAKSPEAAGSLRLWDVGPFQDNITQLQALRPYYAFPDVDIDRYRIDGEIRQVLIAPRALETDLLPASAQTWINLNLQYTHGYGAVAALINSATSEGQPRLILKDAPPEGLDPGLQIHRPQIYFDDASPNPVFVDTNQPEFDYPRGDDNAYNNYRGAAGIPLTTLPRRIAAAIYGDDSNILLSRYFTAQTRLLLHRGVTDRVSTLAPFLQLDPDSYLVVDDAGRLVWLIDAYTSSDLHPYSQPVAIGDSEINYIRNSVKITVDAYDGTVHFYVFDEQDPILAAYQRVFPHLFEPRSAMPADLLRHIRYPQVLFSAQAETYRLYHMQDPQVFYNKEDQWDIARQVSEQESTHPTAPYYMMVQLPGDTAPEFVLLVPFTSHNRDNLIAWVAARCDPAHYGQIIFYRLPKDQLVYGPLQIQSRVDQDRDISKDLSLWNQQGSRVLRGTTLVIPVQGTFLYVEPIYIQAMQARLPELKKIVLAVGNRLVYADDLDGAVAMLAQPPGAEAVAAGAGESGAPATEPATAATTMAPGAATGRGGDVAIPRATLAAIEEHLARYRQYSAQGQYAQAGAELQAAEDALQKLSGGH